MMFDFSGMAGNYEDRKVDRYEEGDDFFISTASVTDSTHPFETAVAHPNYYGGNIVVVENYMDRAEAQAGHDRWVEKMTTGTLPGTLEEVGQSEIAVLGRGLGCDTVFKNEPKE